MGKRNNDLLEMSMRDYFNGDISYEAFINDVNNFGGVDNKLSDDVARRIGFFGQQVQRGDQTEAWGRNNIYQSLDELQGIGTSVTPTAPKAPTTFGDAAQNIVNSAAANKATKENIFSTGSMWVTVNARNNDLTDFTFDKFKKSSQYKGLEKDYARHGDLAMRDTLGQISARTGGLASTYAGGAAQGAYNDYMAKLEEAARQMYQQERSYLADQRDYELSKAKNNYDIFRTERAYVDAIIAAQKAAESKATTDAQNRVADYIGMGGDITKLDSGLITQSGLTDAELQAMRNHFLKNDQVEPEVTDLNQKMLNAGINTREGAINYLMQLDKYDDIQIETMADYFVQNYVKGKSTTEPITPSETTKDYNSLDILYDDSIIPEGTEIVNEISFDGNGDIERIYVKGAGGYLTKRQVEQQLKSGRIVIRYDSATGRLEFKAM